MVILSPKSYNLRNELAGNRVVVELDENGIGLIDVVEYNPKDITENSSINEAQKIITFYEYDPAIETPHFGVICELNNTNEDLNGAPIWQVVPKILQNESNTDYAERAMKKGVRTVVQLNDNEIPSIIKELEKEGKLDNLKEFTTIPGMENDFIVESNSLAINNEINKSI